MLSGRIQLAALWFIAICSPMSATCLAQSTQPTQPPQPTTQPATQPNAAPSSSISPAAQAILDDVRDAYAKVDSLSLAGTVAIDFDAAGHADHRRADFTAALQSPSKFRHEVKDDVLLVSTGEKLISYMVPKNQYYSNESPKRGVEIPEPARGLLQEQNPSLYLALVSDAARELADGTSAIEKIDDVQLSGASYPAIKLTQDDREVRVLVDPKTHLLRQMQVDLTKMLAQQDVPQVKQALVTIDYTTSVSSSAPGSASGRATANAAAAPIDPAKFDPAKFTWTPPPGATLLKPQASEAGDLMGDAGDEDAAQKLVGQPAPAFSLDDLDGKKVSLADLKGSVVVLDFWATWCPPCREGLPHLDELYKSKQADGVKVFAVNLREDAAKARGFIEGKHLSLPVLLDMTGDVAKSYLVSGIPQTVVIGKDGAVKRVLVGFGEGSSEALEQAVTEAVNAK